MLVLDITDAERAAAKSYAKSLRTAHKKTSLNLRPEVIGRLGETKLLQHLASVEIEALDNNAVHGFGDDGIDLAYRGIGIDVKAIDWECNKVRLLVKATDWAERRWVQIYVGGKIDYHCHKIDFMGFCFREDLRRHSPIPSVFGYENYWTYLKDLRPMDGLAGVLKNFGCDRYLPDKLSGMCRSYIDGLICGYCARADKKFCCLEEPHCYYLHGKG